MQDTTVLKKVLQGLDACAEGRPEGAMRVLGKQRALSYGTGSPPKDRRNPCLGVSVCVPQCPISPATSAANDVVRLAMLSDWTRSWHGRG
jgi:hypothetical protein